MRSASVSLVLAVAVSLWASGCAVGKVMVGQPTTAPYALLWASNAAEYRACFLQTYKMARVSITDSLSKRGPEGQGKPLAVVMDLDETVVNNQAFMTFLFLTNQGISWRDWSAWEKQDFGFAPLLPGALAFVRDLEREGITICYVSNRYEANRADNVRLLVDLGLIRDAGEVSGENRTRLQLHTTTSDKQARFSEVESRYEVLAYVGNELTDFPGWYGLKTAEEREALLWRSSDLLGTRYFILPNPMYGPWTEYVDMRNYVPYLPVWWPR